MDTTLALRTAHRRGLDLQQAAAVHRVRSAARARSRAARLAALARRREALVLPAPLVRPTHPLGA
ncbi:hypothetical protein [Thalassiella azotivora]